MTFADEAHKYVDQRAKLLAYLRKDVDKRIETWATRPR